MRRRRSGGRRPVGNGQPESYGAAPQAPQPYQTAALSATTAAIRRRAEPGRAARADAARPRTARPQRDVTGTVRPNTVATLPPEDQPETGKAELPPQFKRQLVTFQTRGARRHDRDRYGEHASLSRARQRAGDALRHRRRPRGLHLGGRRTRLENVRVAGLASAGRDDRAPALSAALHGGRRRQSARRARALSRQDAVPHPRHQPALDDRQVRVVGLHPADQRGHPGSLQPRAGRHARRGAAGQRRRRRPRTCRRRSNSRCSSAKFAKHAFDENARPRAGHFHLAASCAQPAAPCASTITVTCSRSTGSGMVLQLLLEPDQHDAVHGREQRARQQRAARRRHAPARACAAAPRYRRTGGAGSPCTRSGISRPSGRRWSNSARQRGVCAAA